MGEIMIQSKNGMGNKWWSIDFHCHTPASIDYGKGDSQSIYKKITPQEYLKFYMEAGVDAIAVTDHNSGVWIDLLKNAYLEMKNHNTEYFKEMIIFPGVELTVSGNVHLLAIFSENKGTSDIDSLLGAVHYHGTKGESNSCTGCSFVDAVDEIVKLGGIAIPAHCDGEKGLFQEEKGNSLELILDNDNIYAAEMLNKDCDKPQLYIDKKIKWCRVLGSDAHHPIDSSGIKYHGSHYTWIKMTKICFEELSLALRDGDMSVKGSDEIRESPNNYGHCVLEKVTIENAMYYGRRTPFSIEFSPWLNSIIGGRGTGKSTIIEFLRMLTNRTDEIPQSIKEDFQKYEEINRGKNSTGLILENTVLTLDFQKDEQHFKVLWDANKKSSKLLFYKDEEFVDTDGDIINRLPLRIYSQKQIFELSRNPDALMEIINDAKEIAYDDWKEEKKLMTSKFQTLGAKRRELIAGIQNNSEVRGELEDIANKLKIWNKSDSALIYINYTEARKRIVAIDNLKKYLNNRIFDLKKFVEEQNEKIIPLDVDFADLGDEILELWEFSKNTNRTMLNVLHDAETQYTNLISGLDKKCEEGNAYIEYDNAQKEYEKLQEQLASAGIKENDNYSELIKRKEVLEEKIAKEKDTKREICKIESEQEELFYKIFEKYEELTISRKQFLDTILHQNKYVKMNIVKFGNYKSINEFLRETLGKDKGFDKILGNDEEAGLFVKKITEASNVIDGINLIKDELTRIYHGEDIAEYDKKFINLVRGQEGEFIDKVKVWLPDDALEITYSNGKGRFLPIENASPGQKTATLLAFILSYGDEPLILDQPEDDLDNSLISELIVNNIREEKKCRQIIIVTHNANIVVNGDSDNVVVLHVAGGQTQTECQNGLQNIKVREQICSILEGGKEAFRQRYKRINIKAIEE